MWQHNSVVCLLFIICSIISVSPPSLPPHSRTTDSSSSSSRGEGVQLVVGVGGQRVVEVGGQRVVEEGEGPAALHPSQLQQLLRWTVSN